MPVSLPLFACWSQVSARLRRASSVALFLDFDGTLTPLQPRPEGVRLSPPMRRAVSLLEGNPRIRVCVISGRRRADVRNRIAIPGIRYLGLYGWEGRHANVLGASTCQMLQEVKAQARALAQTAPNIWMEDKGAAIVLHYASACPSDALRIRKEMTHSLDAFRGRFRAVASERSVEIAPVEVPDKGATARREWANVSRAALPVFVGDDVVDEPAFSALRQGITIRVGDPAPTRARYRLANVSEVRTFLERLSREVG